MDRKLTIAQNLFVDGRYATIHRTQIPGIGAILRGITANVPQGQEGFSSPPGLRADLFSELSAGSEGWGVRAKRGQTGDPPEGWGLSRAKRAKKRRRPPLRGVGSTSRRLAVASEKRSCPCLLSCYGSRLSGAPGGGLPGESHIRS